MEYKVAIVTGANKGLGFAVVKVLCQSINGTVYLTARDEKRGKVAVNKLRELGLNPVFHHLNVSSEVSVKEFACFLKQRHSKIDYLINNAAILDWNEVYPDYETAKRNIDINYKSLLTIEKYLFPLLNDGARIVNVSSSCGHLSNIKKLEWIDLLKKPDLTEEELNKFVDDYLESVKNKTFNKNDFADDGKHAEHRVSKIAMTALTMIWQRKYPNVSINAVYPGHVKTDMAHGGGEIEPEVAVDVIMYLILKASPNLKGTFMWHNKKLVDWFDHEGDYFCKDLW